MTVKAVVFDLDGTLIESVPGLRASTNRILDTHGRPPVTDDQVRDMIGLGIKVLLQRAFAVSGDEPGEESLDAEVERFKGFYMEDGPAHTLLHPGAETLLRTLSADGVGIGLCTNKPQVPTLALLDRLGVTGHFNAIYGGDRLDGVRKPDPRHVGAVLDELGVGPDDAVMVGDSPIDVAAGRDAGLRVIAVTFGYPLGPVEALGADRLIDHFDEFLGVLAEMERC